MAHFPHTPENFKDFQDKLGNLLEEYGYQLQTNFAIQAVPIINEKNMSDEQEVQPEVTPEVTPEVQPEVPVQE